MSKIQMSKTNRRVRAHASYQRLLDALVSGFYVVKNAAGEKRTISPDRLSEMAEEAKQLQETYHF